MLWKGLLIFARQAFVAPPSKIAFLNSDKVTQLVLADCGFTPPISEILLVKNVRAIVVCGFLITIGAPL